MKFSLARVHHIVRKLPKVLPGAVDRRQQKNFLEACRFHAADLLPNLDQTRGCLDHRKRDETALHLRQESAVALVQGLVAACFEHCIYMAFVVFPFVADGVLDEPFIATLEIDSIPEMQ